jgi:hypothetical protein
MPAKQVNGAAGFLFTYRSNCNGNGAHGMPGLAPKGGSMSRLPSCELLGLRRLTHTQSGGGYVLYPNAIMVSSTI